MDESSTQERKWKVYVHKSPSGKHYVGITCKSLKIRWSNGRGYSKCPLFYKAIRKYGWDNIEHDVLAEDLTKEDACRLERYFIALLKANDGVHGYNITEGGDAVAPQLKVLNGRPVSLYDEYGEWIADYPSISTAARERGMYGSEISDRCKHKKSAVQSADIGIIKMKLRGKT